MKKTMTILLVALCVILTCAACTSKEASAVISDINGLEEITLDSKDVLFSIQAAYDNLSDEDKTSVENYEVLEDAISTYNNLARNEAKKLFDEEKYTEAKALYNEIGEIETYNKLAYDRAEDLFVNEDFEAAKALFADLGDYNDAADFVAKCENELTTDRSFIRALAHGLINRWDYSDDGYKEEFGKDVSEMTDIEHMSYVKKCVQLELDEIQIYADADFENSQLKDAAINYIDILTQSYNMVDYYSMDFERYYTGWESLYADRSISISDFVTSYDLTVDEAHQPTLNGFINNARIAEESKQVEAEVQSMLDSVEIKSDKEEYGEYTYTVTIENTTSVTFDYFDLEADIFDNEEIIVDSIYFGSIENFTPGKKAKLTGYAEEKGETYELHASYSIDY